ncbi:MAG: LysR family transcriptional regulator [Candidatus Parabeggiatoa sp. nov. 3]|nr:MAG: LysR family transcriptional regulator [Gammaproteobacteria bacterium]RKZ66497.1 MAG: LysR family transcriptional regulator [Gammaproteobacteria bacterium]RKZ87587.1 MAG: LysR family transcriptional regulator [Gammaproteobacteria bacterium]
MPDRRLQVFHTVARLLSFTRAAEALHTTQPAVTFQIRQLEEYFNTRLFDRTHNRIALTEVGKQVYEYAEKIFEHYVQMENTVKEMTGEISGVLMIGASTTIAEYLLPVLLGDFKMKYPDVHIRLSVSNTEEIVSMLENNTIDLGMVEAPVNNKNLVVELCRLDQLVAIIPPNHPLATHKAVSVNELVTYPYISREEGSGTRDVITEYFNQAGLSVEELNIVMELGSSEAIKGAVAADMGVSVLSHAAIHKDLQLGLLKKISLEPPLERPFSFVYQKQKFRLRAIEELLKFSHHYCRDHVQ